MEKLCRRCGKTKPTIEMMKVENLCKPCKKDYGREYRRKNKDRLRKQHKEWMEQHPEKHAEYYKNKVKKHGLYKIRTGNIKIGLKFTTTVKGISGTLYKNAQHRAKSKNMEFSITREWITDKLNRNTCDVTGLSFELNHTTARSGPFRPSLDRRDNSLGYTPENTELVCWIYNRAKGEHNVKDVIKFAKALLTFQNNLV